jgi:hypothetical protein
MMVTGELRWAGPDEFALPPRDTVSVPIGDALQISGLISCSKASGR